ncbi:MAG TPA: ABC transporter substrate-binding protein [Solirubrobacteraceae bacterium]|nr:ABC transporter substrate-binding protein [Solirubrobacteraceae bacterium]
MAMTSGDATGTRRARSALVLARVGLALALCGGWASGCGSTSSAPLRQATLVLDFVPNAVHAGIYRALAAGYYRQQGIALRVIEPSATTETLKLIDAGSAQFGLADGSDVMGLIAHGGDAKAVMAIVQRPLGGLIGLAGEGLRSPADLQGRTVGITGVPSDRAVLDTEVRGAGGDPRRVHVATVGFNGAQALVAGRVAAFTGFIPDDGVGLQVGGHPITAFALDRYGGPSYPGLVAFTTQREIAAHPGLVRGFVAATVHGYEDTLADPGRSLNELLAANPSLQRKLTSASLAAYLPLFAGTESHPARRKVAFGTLQRGNVEAMSRWMLANGLIEGPVSASRYGTNEFLP